MRRAFLAAVLVTSLLLAGCAAKPAATTPTTTPSAPLPPAPPLSFSTGWKEGDLIPRRYTCDAVIPDPPATHSDPFQQTIIILIWVLNIVLPNRLGPELDEPEMPPTIVSGEASHGKMVAGYLRDVDDSDHVYWLFWNVPKTKAQFYPATVPDWRNWWNQVPARTPTDAGGVEGLAGRGTDTVVGYKPLCPVGHNAHKFVFTVYVVDDNLTLERGADYASFSAELAKRTIIQEKTITARYSRIPPLSGGGQSDVGVLRLPDVLAG